MIALLSLSLSDNTILLGLVHGESFFFFLSNLFFYDFCPSIYRQYAIGRLPKASRPRENEEATIDPDALVNSIQQIISRTT